VAGPDKNDQHALPPLVCQLFVMLYTIFFFIFGLLKRRIPLWYKDNYLTILIIIIIYFSLILDTKNSQGAYFQITATASIHNATYEESSFITSPSAKVQGYMMHIRLYI